MHRTLYKGFTITARTFQVRTSRQWTLDFLIGRRDTLRAFSGPDRYGSEAAAEAGCVARAKSIIDRSRPDCLIGDLVDDKAWSLREAQVGGRS